MKIRFNWKISALGNICLSILSIIIFSQPAFGYSMTNNPRVKEAFTSLLKESSINGRIAFSYNIGGNWEIYTVNPDGTEPTRVTNNTYDDYGPTWSPDGAKIAFYSRRPSTNPTIYTSQIYTMNADGTDEQCLTTEGIENVFPAWSHNGSTIAYSSYQNGNYDIYIMDADGNNKQGLTSTPESEALASWSPNDSEIVFSSNKNGNLDIYKIRINNRKISQITSDANNNETHPRVSPDGTKIVYETYGLQGGPATIWLVDVNGENPHQIQFGGATPSWSPDGKYIVFVSGKIFVMNPDGSNIQAVSSDFLNCSSTPFRSTISCSSLRFRVFSSAVRSSTRTSRSSRAVFNSASSRSRRAIS